MELLWKSAHTHTHIQGQQSSKIELVYVSIKLLAFTYVHLCCWRWNRTSERKRRRARNQQNSNACDRFYDKSFSSGAFWIFEATRKIGHLKKNRTEEITKQRHVQTKFILLFLTCTLANPIGRLLRKFPRQKTWDSSYRVLSLPFNCRWLSFKRNQDERASERKTEIEKCSRPTRLNWPSEWKLWIPFTQFHAIAHITLKMTDYSSKDAK